MLWWLTRTTDSIAPCVCSITTCSMLLQDVSHKIRVAAPLLWERLRYDELLRFLDASQKLLPMIALTTTRRPRESGFPLLPPHVAKTLSTHIRLPLSDVNALWSALGSDTLKSSALPDLSFGQLANVASEFGLGRRHSLLPRTSLYHI